MHSQLAGFLVLLLLSLAAPAVLFFPLRSSLHDLLQHTIQLPAGVTFYLRSFFLVLFLSALSAAIGTTFDMKPDSHFMEYVWKEAEGLSSSIQLTLTFAAIYVAFITILVATLKVKNDR